MAAVDGLMAVLNVLARGGLARGRAAARRIALAAVCFALAGLAALGVCGFAVAVLWILVLPHVGSLGAALICGGSLLALTLLLCVLALVFLRRDRARQRPGAEAEALLPVVEALLQLKDQKGALLLVALAAGLVAGGGSKGR